MPQMINYNSIFLLVMMIVVVTPLIPSFQAKNLMKSGSPGQNLQKMYFFDDFGSLKCNKLVNRHVLRPLLSSSSSETPSSSFSSSSSLVLFSPSKINLFLRIIEKVRDAAMRSDEKEGVVRKEETALLFL